MLELIAAQKNIYRELRLANEKKDKDLNLSSILVNTLQDLELQLRKLNVALSKNSSLVSTGNSKTGGSSTPAKAAAAATAPAAATPPAITTEIKSDTHTWTTSTQPDFGVFANQLQLQNVSFESTLSLIKARYGFNEQQSSDLRKFLYEESRRSPHTTVESMAKSLYGLAMNNNGYEEAKTMLTVGNDIATANQLDSAVSSNLLDHLSFAYKVDPATLGGMVTKANIMSKKGAQELNGYLYNVGTKAKDAGFTYQEVAGAFISAEGKLSEREVSNALQVMMTEVASAGSKTKAEYKDLGGLSDLLLRMDDDFKGKDKKQQLAHIESLFGTDKATNETIRKMVLDSQAMLKTSSDIAMNKVTTTNMAQAPFQGVTGSALKFGNEMDLTKKELALSLASPMEMFYNLATQGLQGFQQQKQPDGLFTTVSAAILGDSIFTAGKNMWDFAKGKFDAYTSIIPGFNDTNENSGTGEGNSGGEDGGAGAGKDGGGGDCNDKEKGKDCCCCCCKDRDKPGDVDKKDKNNWWQGPHTKPLLTASMAFIGAALYAGSQSQIDPKPSPVIDQPSNGYDGMTQPEPEKKSLWDIAQGNLNTVKIWATDVGNSAIESVSGKWNELSAAASNFGASVANKASETWDGVSTWTKEKWNGFTSAYSDSMVQYHEAMLINNQGKIALGQKIRDVLLGPAALTAVAVGGNQLAKSLAKSPNPYALAGALALFGLSAGAAALMPEEASAQSMSESQSPSVSQSTQPPISDDLIKRHSLWNLFSPNLGTGITNTGFARQGIGPVSTTPLSSSSPIHSPIQTTSNATINLNVNGYVDHDMINLIKDNVRQQFDASFNSFTRYFDEKVPKQGVKPPAPPIQGQGGMMPY
ncbi:hypothetical protein [Paenibacillus arenosi]|uniref:Phage tail tape measure protein domain-containing protein n=1 Tax=Paenibacillus arenosi TaxID=2774142 RepID=A0ABR9AW62_9BACL|nr:hypothetical protein [Paenibacillus arenosi]MBD8498370.1 hypothetical protein [Paenibacillus arenosi]